MHRHYDLCGRTYLFSIDFHHLKIDMEDPEEFDNLYVVDAYHAGNVSAREPKARSRLITRTRSLRGFW